MGWRGVLRSIAAAQRRAERESIRHQRELERQAKAVAKLRAFSEAANEVKLYENLVERLRSIHIDCADAWDWNALAAAPEPKQPVPTFGRKVAAQLKFDNYRPNIFIKLLGLTGARRNKLAAAIKVAQQTDTDQNNRAEAEFRERHAGWKEAKELAERIIRHDLAAFREALEEVKPFSEISDLGSRVVISSKDDRRISVTLHVNGDSVIPSETKTLLKSGKLSTKKMPQGQFYDLYQDYVCGAVFRVAREIFALLPVDIISITAMCNMLDTSSGHMKDQPILSVVMPRSTIEKLNFETLDPSDALRNFVHHMDFKKSKGFCSVDVLELDAVTA